MPDPLLQIEGLTVDYRTDGGPLRAVDIERLSLRRGETVGLVGESGSGKSSVALALLRLLPPHVARLGGSVRLGGEDLFRMGDRALRRVRGRRMAMIFQDPSTALNPVFTVGEQIARVVHIHEGGNWQTARGRAEEMLALVGMPDPGGVLARYPHELSGGQRQRVMIAMALSCGPDLLIADEPTTALDVTIEAQILQLLQDLQQQLGMAILLITHDLGVVAQSCDRVAIMYAGRILEEAAADALFRQPFHPYTRGLLDSLPRRGRPLQPIEGTVPDLRRLPPGCYFAPRCPLAEAACRTEPPALLDFGPDRRAACPVVHAREVEAHV